MTHDILIQLAHTPLLSSAMASAILDGEKPALNEVVLALVISSMDCAAMTINDPDSTLFDRRLARQMLASAFLSALACVTDSPTVFSHPPDL
jgi:hypothetical protein